jgi:hypothetical protein
MEFLFLALLFALVCAILGSWVSKQKGRESEEGAALGCLFGPFGVLVGALMPNAVKQPPPPPDPAAIAAAAAAEAKRQADYQAFLAKQAADAAAQAERNRIAWENFKAKFAAFFRPIGNAILWVVTGRWYGASPDWLRPIYWGLGIALPVVCLLIAIRSMSGTHDGQVPPAQTRTESVQRASPAVAPPAPVDGRKADALASPSTPF